MSAGPRFLRCQALWQRSGWISPAYIELDRAGCIVSVKTKPDSRDTIWEDLGGYAIPGGQNAHSHAFQYAMAGLAEHRPAAGSGRDFWSWREEMYRCALLISPEQMQAVAAMVYAQMLRAGYTAVAEFHYLHHDKNGRPYAEPAEMSLRLQAAAKEAGIQLTLIPVLYQKSGFHTPPRPEQRRFVHAELDAYRRLLEPLHRLAAAEVDFSVGVGVHSLRAVGTEEVLELFSSPFRGPAHLHVAEQRSEVDQCLQGTRQRPVAWLLDHLPLDRRFNLVHATHLAKEELKGLAQSDATVVLAPSTEANLGDGFFPLKAYWDLGGRFAIGSDSQVGLSPLEELRWLDYGQRLQLRKRQVLKLDGGLDSGTEVYAAAWTRGRLALGLSSDEFFAPGEPFDAVIIDPLHPAIYGKPAAQRLSALIYAGTSDCLLGTIRRGRWLCQKGRHLHELAIRRNYAKAIDGIHRAP